MVANAAFLVAKKKEERRIVTEDHLRIVVWIVATAGETTRFPEDVAATMLGLYRRIQGKM